MSVVRIAVRGTSTDDQAVFVRDGDARLNVEHIRVAALASADALGLGLVRGKQFALVLGTLGTDPFSNSYPEVRPQFRKVEAICTELQSVHAASAVSPWMGCQQ